MRSIYRFEVMDELAKGNDVYAVILTGQKPMVENAATITGKVLANYINSDGVDWYVSDKETQDGGQL